MKPKEIAGLDEDVLKMDSVIYNLTAEHLKTIGREGVKTKTLNYIYSKILEDEEHPAHNYARTSPSRTLRGAQPNTSSTPTTSPTTPTPTPPSISLTGTTPNSSTTTPANRITNPDIRNQLAQMGYNSNEIDRMSPEEGQRIIAENLSRAYTRGS